MSSISRRRFLKRGAALAAGAVALGAAPPRAIAANDKIGVAVIGVRGQGGSLLHTFAAQPDVAVTHICDLDESVRARRGKQVEESTRKAPRLIKDYRDLLADHLAGQLHS